jgi:hypothetical protein
MILIVLNFNLGNAQKATFYKQFGGFGKPESLVR